MKKSDTYFINDIKNAINSIEEYLLEINDKKDFLSNKECKN